MGPVITVTRLVTQRSPSCADFRVRVGQPPLAQRRGAAGPLVASVIVIEPMLRHRLAQPLGRIGGLGLTPGSTLADRLVKAVEQHLAPVGADPPTVGVIVAAAEIAPVAIDPAPGAGPIDDIVAASGRCGGPLSNTGGRPFFQSCRPCAPGAPPCSTYKGGGAGGAVEQVAPLLHLDPPLLHLFPARWSNGGRLT
jgi:hypothetical protein